jgi:hypothetical protein
LFDDIVVPSAEVVRSTWHEMVSTSSARYDGIAGDYDSAIRRRLAFHDLWGIIWDFTSSKVLPLDGIKPHLDGYFLLPRG